MIYRTTSSNSRAMPSSARTTLNVVAILTPAATAMLTPTWIAGTGSFAGCHRITRIFEIPICLTRAAWAVDAARYNHVANVVAQLLDNDADSVVDDAVVHARMVSRGSFLFVPATEQDSEAFNPDD